MHTRLIIALVLYGALALLATFTLDGLMRIAVWLFLGALALKSWIGMRLRQ